MFKITVFVLTFTFCLTASSSESDSRIKLLDEALQKQDYEKILTTLYPQTTQKDNQPTELDSIQDLKWLESKSELGHIPLYYALSWKLMKTDITKSREMNARGRIGLMLDANECIKPPRFTPLYVLLEGRAIENNMPLRDDDTAWSVAVDEALMWYKNQPKTPSAVWHCGINNLLEPDKAKSSRDEYWKKIKYYNDPHLPNAQH